jgi:pyruvate,orthophosphate dikinase
MFGKTVQGIEGEQFDHALDEMKERKGVTGDLDLDAADVETLDRSVSHGG